MRCWLKIVLKCSSNGSENGVVVFDRFIRILCVIELFFYRIGMKWDHWLNFALPFDCSWFQLNNDFESNWGMCDLYFWIVDEIEWIDWWYLMVWDGCDEYSYLIQFNMNFICVFEWIWISFWYVFLFESMNMHSTWLYSIDFE